MGHDKKNRLRRLLGLGPYPLFRKFGAPVLQVFYDFYPVPASSREHYFLELPTRRSEQGKVYFTTKMSSETLAFREYLEMLCIELADFQSLAIPVRMELLSGCRQQSQSPPSAADVAAPLPKTSTKLAKTPSPPAES
jgi:hypothetical protein